MEAPVPAAVPNLLLIVSDQQHPDMVGALGRIAVQTLPEMALANDRGVVARVLFEEALQSLVDIAPTFLAAAGIGPHPRMQGIDALPNWRNPDHPTRDAVLVEQRVERGLYVN